jgi:hypothetical protein
MGRPVTWGVINKFRCSITQVENPVGRGNKFCVTVHINARMYYFLCLPLL